MDNGQRTITAFLLTIFFFAISFFIIFFCGWITTQIVLAQGLPPDTPCNGGTQLDYENPASCVSGYVYANGKPIEGATVVITAPNGREQSQVTQISIGAERPSYGIILEQPPLNVKPGEKVTITASYDGLRKIDSFTAREGTIQIDVILPVLRPDSAWMNAHLSARHDHAMVYDAARQEIVLFGGRSIEGDHLGDTWIYTDIHTDIHTGQIWQQKISTNNPTPRHGHTLIYDSTRSQVLLFGGQDVEGSYLNDLWAWDGISWAQLTPEDEPLIAPPARTEHSAAYHEDTQQMIVFGGHNGDGTLDDTWLWSGGHWQQAIIQSPLLSPSKRLHHAMAYHREQQKTILFGGRVGINDSASFLNDSWAWDGTGWQKLEPTNHPPSSADHRMVYMAALQQIALFGGNSINSNGSSTSLQNSLQNSLWMWNGETWESKEIEQKPRPRNHHAMAYDEQQQQIVLFGGQYNTFLGVGDLADTWHGNIENRKLIWQQVNPPPDFTRWQDVAMTYEEDNNFLIFGGLAGTALQGIPQSDTFRWQSSTWEKLTPDHSPPARYAHELARSTDGTRILLFGGIGVGNSYLNDTWAWQDQDWVAQSPREPPPSRAYHAMTYDSIRGEWLLFGGLDEEGNVLNDLWTYNGIEWKRRNSPRPPAARMRATLVYDTENRESLLFAGRGMDNSYLNDLWTWDGIGWQERTTSLQPPPRAGHGAAYDPVHNRMVIAGGKTGSEQLDDTWLWDGQAWRRRQARPPIPTTYLHSLDYDPLNEQFIGMGEQIGGNRLGEGILIYRALSGLFDTNPIATISYVNPKDVRQPDVIYFEGRGGDGDGSDIIAAHRWTHDGSVISTQQAFSLTADILPLGTQTLHYDVQDDEGNWSQKIAQQVYVRDQVAGTGDLGRAATWTLLIYAAGDNDLAPWLGNDPFRKGMLYRLRDAGQQDRVQVGVLYDGDGENDTYRYILDSQGRLQEEAVDEADMGDAADLQAFVEWGYENFESDYYALHIASHANGIIGIALDEHVPGQNSTASSFLTPFELRSGLQIATQSGSRRLEVIHFDGCSFGLLENAALVDGLAHYAVASPNTALGYFTYETYRQLAANSATPQDYAKSIAEHYATLTTKEGTAHTISVFNMKYFDEVRQAVDDLGSQLLAYARSNIEELPRQLAQLREGVQKYDSGGITNFDIDVEDEYVDLGAWAKAISTHLAHENDLAAASRQVTASLAQFVHYEQHKSGHIRDQQAELYDITLDDSHGIGIYYPKSTTSASSSAYTAYQENKLFHITKGWGWTNFLAFGIPTLGPTDAPLMERTNLLVHSVPTAGLTYSYLPVIMR